jgi:hypothetical protein
LSLVWLIASDLPAASFFAGQETVQQFIKGIISDGNLGMYDAFNPDYRSDRKTTHAAVTIP